MLFSMLRSILMGDVYGAIGSHHSGSHRDGPKTLHPRHACHGRHDRGTGAGHTIEELLADYPYLQREDILQALRYAAWLAEEREVSLPPA
jgi:hypothetical protein